MEAERIRKEEKEEERAKKAKAAAKLTADDHAEYGGGSPGHSPTGGAAEESGSTAVQIGGLDAVKDATEVLPASGTHDVCMTGSSRGRR